MKYSTSFEFQLYDQNYTMVVNINATTVPQLDFSPSGGKVSFKGQIYMYVQQAPGLMARLSYVFTSPLTVQTSGQSTFFIQASQISVTDVKVVFSQIPGLNASYVSQQINAQIPSGLILVNSYLKANAFTIPSVGGISYSNPTVQFGAGYIVASLTPVSQFKFPLVFSDEKIDESEE